MQVSNGLVLIRPNEPLEKIGGLSFVTDKPQFLYSNFAKVIKAPKKVVCPIDLHLAFKEANFKGSDVATLLYHVSNEFDCDVEVEDGDMVICSYSMNFKQYKNGEYSVLPYDQILGKVTDDGIIGCNGYLFIELPEKRRFDGMMWNKDLNQYGQGYVISDTKPVRSMKDHPHLDLSVFDFPKGSYVGFEQKNTMKLEKDEYNTMNRGKQSSIFVIHGRHIQVLRH